MTYQSSNNLGSSPLSIAHGSRVRRASMELNPTQLYMDAGFVRSSLQQDPLSLLLQQDPSAATAITGTAAQSFLQPTMVPDSESLGLSSIDGHDSLTLDAEEPGPLPCLPRSSRLGAPFNNHSSLLLQQQQQQLQQLQRSGYPTSGASRLRQQVRPRRHSVTIGMLNESQQALLSAAAAAGQLPAGFSQSCNPGTSQWAILQQQLAAQQPPQGQQVPPPGLPAGLQQSSTHLGLGPIGLGDAYAGTLLQQLNGQAPVAITGSSGVGSSNSLAGLDMMPAHALSAPRLPGGGNSRRHSWAPMSADYAHQCLLLQQQRASNLTAQFGDAGALFLNQQQHEHLGLAGVGGATPVLNGFSTPGVAGIHTPVVGGIHNGALLSGDSDLGSGSNALMQPGPVLPLFNDVAKEQLAQQLQQQLQQLQLQQQSARSRLPGATRALDPYAEPFVSQAATLLPSALGNLSGISSLDPLTAALQRQQQTALTGLHFDDAGLGAAATSMYAPLQVDGIAVDTQLLVSPYVDNWDVLNQASLAVPAGPLPLPLNGNGISPIVSSVPVPLATLAIPAMSNNITNSKPKGVPGRSNGGSNGSAIAHLSAGSLPVSNGKTASASQLSTAAAAVAAAAAMVASLPPLSKVCSDVPWDLKKAADEDAKLLALQQSQLQKLAAVLEHSRTLQKVHAAAAEGASASVARGENGKLSGAENAQVSFSYQLPDTGDDTWGGSSASASVPGGSCISQEPSNKLFVGNIGWWVTEEDLLHWFSRFGTVINVKIMYNSRKMHKPKDKWRSREYGFIDYACPEEAAKAIVWMDGVELPELVKDTCGIIVQYAKPTSSNEGAAGGEA